MKGRTIYVTDLSKITTDLKRELDAIDHEKNKNKAVIAYNELLNNPKLSVNTLLLARIPKNKSSRKNLRDWKAAQVSALYNAILVISEKWNLIRNYPSEISSLSEEAKLYPAEEKLWEAGVLKCENLYAGLYDACQAEFFQKCEEYRKQTILYKGQVQNKKYELMSILNINVHNPSEEKLSSSNKINSSSSTSSSSTCSVSSTSVILKIKKDNPKRKIECKTEEGSKHARLEKSSSVNDLSQIAGQKVSLEQENKKLNEKIEDLKSQVQMLQNANAALKKKNEELQNANDIIRGENDSLNNLNIWLKESGSAENSFPLFRANNSLSMSSLSDSAILVSSFLK